jgi:transposase
LQRFTPGTVLVFDRGYNDYDWFGELSDQGVFFVTRMKDNAKYIVLQERVIPRRKGLIKDQIICFLNEAQAQEAQQQLAHRYRRIEFYDEAHDRVLFFVTNHMSLAAATVAEVYKQRWQIELFFKALKQSLRVKTFVGTSANALKIQIWSALIAMLMIKYLQLRSTFGWSLSNLVALLRQQLFVYRHLWTWIDDPFQPPNAIAEISPQMDLAF